MPSRHPTRSTSDPTLAGRWNRLLDDIRLAAYADGVTAAEWWAQDTIGGRASGDLTAAARTTLAGIDAVDPLVLDALPQPAADGPACTYRERAGDDLPTWDALDPQRRAEAADAYRVGFDDGLTDQVRTACTTVLAPVDQDPAPPIATVRKGH